ncbi:hypothetical protein NPX99_07845 [Bartonella sp. 220]|uniref:hypothetical protein n=1 Tax=Bartonella sp. 220B TaxID=2967260 RepID=UPI0022A973FF|nr:hypothetical protein [Bartonella sp. 220B]MCZ2159157.1 hypothetical protein [Bartonella sp. 220B]
MKKYEFTEETRKIEGVTLYRIRALRDFGNVKAGDRGGFIEKEENLSHEGNCWVAGNAWVFNDAHVYGNAKVLGSARIKPKARVYDNAVICGASKIHGSVYGSAQVTGYHTIRGLVHGNAILKRKGSSYHKQNYRYIYGIPKDCEIYEGDTVVKIVENQAA